MGPLMGTLGEQEEFWGDSQAWGEAWGEVRMG